MYGRAEGSTSSFEEGVQVDEYGTECGEWCFENRGLHARTHAVALLEVCVHATVW